MAPGAVGVALEQGLVVGRGDADVGGVAVDQVLVLIDGLVSVVGSR